MNGKGAILIENNLSWNNGGRGIQVLGSQNVLIRNNTCAWNERTPETVSGAPTSDLRAQASKNCIFQNNILAALPGQEFRDNWQSHDITYTDNVLYGYRTVWAGMTNGNLIGVEPQFRDALPGSAVPDFRLKPGSPATGKGGLPH